MKMSKINSRKKSIRILGNDIHIRHHSIVAGLYARRKNGRKKKEFTKGETQKKHDLVDSEASKETQRKETD